MTDRIHLNSFQEWARGYAEAKGATATPYAQWVVVSMHGLAVECMSEQGVRVAIRDMAAA